MEKGKEYRRAIIIGVIFTAFIIGITYLAFAFVIKEFNPLSWQRSEREAVAVLVIMELIVAFPLTMIIKTELED